METPNELLQTPGLPASVRSPPTPFPILENHHAFVVILFNIRTLDMAGLKTSLATPLLSPSNVALD